MPVVAEFTRRFPAVRVDFSLVTWRVAQERLVARDVDVAIVTEPEAISSLFHAELSATRLMAVLRREHTLACRQSLKLAELA
ncbi:LysR substrate-binding domain-containing protein, partial [Streptomyces scabiei]|uniref:LysR substrate-binding domain-containing protein n=1 Tax=Streptomyces scabiei TaxID=1930 RepID=UPI0038F60149